MAQKVAQKVYLHNHFLPASIRNMEAAWRHVDNIALVCSKDRVVLLRAHSNIIIILIPQVGDCRYNPLSRIETYSVYFSDKVAAKF